MPETPRPPSMKAMPGQRAFRTLWVARFVSIFGDFIALFGVISSDLLRALLAVALVFVVDVRQIGLILAAISVVSSFFGPALSVALRTLVAPQDLLTANALMAQGFYLVRLLSPYWLARWSPGSRRRPASGWTPAASFFRRRCWGRCSP